MKRTIIASLLLVSLLFVLSGCMGMAYYTANLKYKPVFSQEPGNNITVKVKPFTDNNPSKLMEKDPDKYWLGMKNDSVGMKANVVTQEDVASWVRDSFIAELRKAGYTTTDLDAQYEVSGIIEKVTCGSTMEYLSQIELNIIVTKNNEVVLNKNYAAHSKGLCWTEANSGYTNVLTKALQNIMKEIMGDINNVAT